MEPCKEIKKIMTLLSEQGKTQKDLTDYLGITQNAFTDWKSGRIKSWNKHLPQIAEFLNVTVDCILCKTEKPAENGEAKAVILDMYKDHEKALIEAYRNNPGMQEAVDRLLGIQQNDRVILYAVAESEDHHRDQYIEKDKKEWEQIKGTPNTDDPLV